MDNYSFDDAKFYLGKLCRNEHEWEGSGQSLRYLNGEQRCLVCQKGRTKRRYQKLDIDKERIRKRENYHANLERSREVKRRNRKKWRDANPGKDKEYRQSEAGRLCAKRSREKRRKLGKCKLRDLKGNNQRRSLLNMVHSFPFENYQLETLMQAFGHSCAYCGASEKITLDHFIPLSKGGCNVLGNLLPACQFCNFSKNNHDAETWYKQQKYFSLARWKKIKKYLGSILQGQLPLF